MMMDGGMTYGGGLVWILVLAVLVIYPFWRLLPRFGIPAWVALVAIVPFGAIVLLWVMAFRNGGAGGTA